MEVSTLVLPANLLITALALVMSGIAIVFQIRKDRLPHSTRYENIRELAEQATHELNARKAELSIVEQKIADRDRLIAEVSALEERLRLLKAELASLDSARREIEEVKADAAEAAAELATVEQKLQSRRDELERVTRDLDPARIAELERELAQLEQARNALEQGAEQLRAERDVALRTIEEARNAQAGLAALAIERGSLQEECRQLQQARTDLLPQVESLRGECEAARRILHDARTQEARLETLARERERLEQDLHDLRQRLESTAHELEAREALQLELSRLRDRRQELNEEVTHLVANRERLAKETGGQAPADVSALLDDLTRFPDVLARPARLLRAPRTENDALADVNKYLRQHGLSYGHRTVRAFHTALKINDNAQLAVLAGVSGTGKSLLPRRYAEAMGIHFLQIAVEPRWDSPQDLLGFYNYIEKRYRATDLARLLVHMDPFDTAHRPAGSENRSDHMALVLLDEMNLARVEYYFSEFLSRLEVRPRVADVADPRKRQDAQIPIDIRGLNHTVSLFPPHNVLFAGTMNDDESTQSLSDKVLDRGNVMQFAAPKDFTSKPQVAKSVSRPEEAQSFASWRTWVRSPDQLDGGDRDKADAVIASLADIMENCGRPFGHRLRDSILAYVASYPKNETGRMDVNLPLADQIEFRILPKLRGIDLSSHGEPLEKLENLLRNDLADAAFGDRLGDLRERQRAQTGLFVWRGLTRED